MSNDIASDGLFGICSEHGSSIYLCHHLVRDDDGHAKLQEKQPKTIISHNYFPQSEQKSREKDTGALLVSISVGSSLSKPMGAEVETKPLGPFLPQQWEKPWVDELTKHPHSHLTVPLA